MLKKPLRRGCRENIMLVFPACFLIMLSSLRVRLLEAGAAASRLKCRCCLRREMFESARRGEASSRPASSGSAVWAEGCGLSRAATLRCRDTSASGPATSSCWKTCRGVAAVAGLWAARAATPAGSAWRPPSR